MLSDYLWSVVDLGSLVSAGRSGVHPELGLNTSAGDNPLLCCGVFGRVGPSALLSPAPRGNKVCFQCGGVRVGGVWGRCV